jgi:hypothetical protein
MITLNNKQPLKPIVRKTRLGNQDYIFSFITTPVVIQRNVEVMPQITLTDMPSVMDSFNGICRADKNGVVLMDTIWPHEFLSSMGKNDLEYLADEVFKSVRDGGYVSSATPSIADNGKKMLGHVLGVMFWKDGSKPEWGRKAYSEWHKRFSRAVEFQLVDRENILGVKCMDLASVDRGLWNCEIENARITIDDLAERIGSGIQTCHAQIEISSTGLSENRIDVSIMNRNSRVIADLSIHNDETLCTLYDLAMATEDSIKSAGVSKVSYNYANGLT